MRYFFPFIASVVGVFNYQVSPRLIPFLPRIMENIGQIETLLNRLSEAERRAKLLKLEVKSIRQEIAALHNNIRIGQNTQNVNITIGQGVRGKSDGENSDNRIWRSAILIDPLPGPFTTEIDGSDDAESTGSSFVESSTFTGPGASKKFRASFNKTDDHVIVYTDGACENNGKPNAKAGIGVWFGDNHPLNISKPVEGRATNNTAEIQACIQALHQLRDQGEKKVKIITDSQFTINCITKWITNWKRNNWKTTSGGSVKNKEDLQKLDEIIKSFADVQWHHVNGHNGIKGNEEADKLARNGALSYRATRK